MNTHEKYEKALQDLVNNKKIDANEYDRLSLSDLRWALAKQKHMPERRISKGSVYQFDFGKNSVPEMSYEHRGLVIGRQKSLLYVLPIFTYRETNHKKDLYDPATSKGRQGNLYLIHACDYSFIKHDSVLKLNDLRSISIKRLLFKQPNGSMSPSSDEYKQIVELAFSRHFPEQHYEMRSLREEISNLKAKLASFEAK